MVRWRGPSSSARMMLWNLPRDRSPPLIPTATLRPSSAARRWAWAFPRSQSEQRDRRVERVDEEDAFLHIGTQDDVSDLPGDVVELRALLAQERERLSHHLQRLHADPLPSASVRLFPLVRRGGLEPPGPGRASGF